MNKELKSVCTWFKTNKLCVNTYKIKWTIFHPNSKKHFIPWKFSGPFIDGIVLEREIVTKFLRVIIDEKVTWKTHINTISTKISRIIGTIYRSRPLIATKQLNQLYFSLCIVI